MPLVSQPAYRSGAHRSLALANTLTESPSFALKLSPLWTCYGRRGGGEIQLRYEGLSIRPLLGTEGFNLRTYLK